jgi:3'-5' exoribonuclease
MNYCLIKNIRLLKDKNGGDYLVCILRSEKGTEVEGKKWRLSAEDVAEISALKEGSIIAVTGEMDEWQGKKQFIIKDLITLTEKEIAMIDVSAYIETAPEDSKVMLDFIKEKIRSLKSESLKKLLQKAVLSNEEKLLSYPAAKTNHHAYYGGLLYHIKRMLESAEALLPIYSNLDRDLLLTGVILHDIGKLKEMDANDIGIVSDYFPEGNMLTHIVLGVLFVSENAKEAGLSEQEKLMVEHMILSHHYLPEFGSPVSPAFPEAEMLHHLDNMDAKLTLMEKEIGKVDQGKMSSWIAGLDGRRVYNRTEDGAGVSEPVQLELTPKE